MKGVSKTKRVEFRRGSRAGRAILMGPVVYDLAALKRLVNSLKLTERDHLIGIDGGTLVWLQLGVIPDFCIGDWDSLSDSRQRAAVLHQIPHMTLPRRKDRSDLHHAAKLMQELGVSRFVFLGVTGGRPDHHMATLLELAELAERRGVQAVDCLGEEGSYHFLSAERRSWKAGLGRGRGVSIFALGAPVRGVRLKGFEYPLQDETLEPGSRGLSNVTLSREVEVSFSGSPKGASLLVIVPR